MMTHLRILSSCVYHSILSGNQYKLPVDTDTSVSSSHNIQLRLENLDSSRLLASLLYLCYIVHFTVFYCPPVGFQESNPSEFPTNQDWKAHPRCHRCHLPSECCGAVQKARAARGICNGFTGWLETKLNKLKHWDFAWVFLMFCA